MLGLRFAQRASAAVSRGPFAAQRRAVSTADLLTTSKNKEVWPSVKDTMLPQNYEQKMHHVKSTKMWVWINWLLVAPTMLAVAYYTVPVELAHMKHLDEHANEWSGIPYLRRRKNPFPWGDDSLFHHPNANPSPPADE